MLGNQVYNSTRVCGTNNPGVNLRRAGRVDDLKNNESDDENRTPSFIRGEKNTINFHAQIHVFQVIYSIIL